MYFAKGFIFLTKTSGFWTRPYFGEQIPEKAPFVFGIARTAQIDLLQTIHHMFGIQAHGQTKSNIMNNLTDSQS